MNYLHHNGVSLCYRTLEEDDDFVLEFPQAQGHWFVSSIMRTGTMRGQATTLLDDLLHLAREEERRVYLIAHASESPDTLSQDALLRWYTRRGFEQLCGSVLVWS